MINLKSILFLFVFCLSFAISAQNRTIDSLDNLLQNHPAKDIIRINLLNDVAKEYFTSDKEKALLYINESIKLSDSLGLLQEKAKSLSILGNYYNNNSAFDKAINIYKESANISELSRGEELANTTRKLGYCYCMVGNTSEGISCFEKVLLIYEEEGSKLGIANIYNNLGNVYQMTGDIDLAVEYYNKSIQIWKDVGNKAEVANLQNNLGYLYMNQDQSYNALEAYFTALKIYEELDNKSRIAMVQNGIGGVYQGLNELDKAKEYYLLALKTNESINKKLTIAYCLSNLANIANEESESEDALTYCNRAYSLLSELGLKNKMGKVLNNQSKAYKNLGDYKSAIEASEKALIFFKETEDRVGEGSTYDGLALTYFDMNKYEKAKYYALNGLEISEEFDQLQLQKAAHEILFKIYKLEKDYKKALIHHEQFMSINDSLYNEDNIRKITGLEYKYKFEKEKQAIELEQEKKDAIQAEEVKYQIFMRNSFVAGFILALLLIIVILYSYIQKRKDNNKLSKQNNLIKKQKEEKELLVKEMHHRVKNNLQIISSLLNLQMRSTDNPGAKTALIDGLNRVKSVALIHQLLYQNDDAINVDFEDFVTKLIDHITSATTNKHIEKSIEVPPELQFDIKTTIPLGLIITELLTNAFKYAFDTVETCEIFIRVMSIKNDKYILEVKDNGGGLPEEFDFNTSKSLGLRLVRTLTQQLSGELEYIFDKGSKFSLTFSKIASYE